MQVSQSSSTSVVAKQGVGQTATFGIAQNAHMFNVLSSGLYGDKIGAVEREVGCNAMDAHIFGRMPTRPIEVKLPTKLDLQFYIKDWGPGLSDEEVKGIYTVYGVSTKQQSNDQTGGFGLGSKSPFAYTLFDPENEDGFTVVAVKEGKKRVYVCHLDDNGSPAVTDMGVFDADPDWQSGVMVTFPVQDRDIAEFHAKAQEIFQWFTVPPRILGMEKPLKKPEFHFEGSFFNMGAPFGTSGETFHRVPAVVMANVRYPIEKARLRDLTPNMQALLDGGIHLFVDNGEVLMAVSREALQYTDKTRSAIMARLDQAVKEVAERVRADVMTKEPTKLAWYRKVHSYVSTLPSSIRMNLISFLKEAGVGKDDIEHIRQVANESALTFPKVGDGIMGKQQPYQKDADGDWIRDVAGNPVVDATWQNNSCRVWLYRSTETGIRKKEVVNGYQDFTKDKPVLTTVPVLSDTRVYYSDSKSADARIRYALRQSGSPTDAFFLVVAGRGVDAVHAKALGERICGPDGIEGLPCAGTSTLPVSPSYASDLERRRMRKSMTLEELTAGEEVTFTTFAAGGTSKTTLGDIEEEAEKFYVIRRRDRFMNHGSTGWVGPRERDFCSTMRTMQRVLKRLGHEVAGAVMVESEATVRRLKLVELGYRPLMTWTVGKLKSGSNWKRLVASIDRTPKADLAQPYIAKQYSLLGILAMHLLKRTPAWEALEPRLAGHPLLEEVAAFAFKVNGALGDDDLATELKYLQSHIDGAYLDVTECKRKTPYEVSQSVGKSYPLASSIFDDDALLKVMAESPEKAATMLVTALALDPLPGERVELEEAEEPEDAVQEDADEPDVAEDSSDTQVDVTAEAANSDGAPEPAAEVTAEAMLLAA
ncbi:MULTISPECIES: ATP-binding protein [unclassified Variovorax]|uniref:ATP-binding protein n=1 Tax=unclassified Variovorax TaxID=663243 RepID=UPI00076D5EE1|nr:MULTISPECIES: ATP-binding protein [unclassified Variovorax]KWT98426.1 rIIA [Variovorax sp. WDL1]PNG49905.1 hypothetical protein CHC06_05486 [Variovorax sp. B2]PNG50777.1 hypothetical protein CHC07_05391 [Variovorax sp. B4]VTU42071.1 hypothetical protein H6P1_00103 [Variovorax sp. PBL-H6]VTU44275.1 hypothetical protein SRS16P1_00799 [Variovorax sp. SRS16]